MSHFTVLVIGDDPEGQLEPFDENLSVPAYKSYERGNPADYWGVRMLRDSGHLTKPDAELTWQDLADAINVHYGDNMDESERHFVDEVGMYQMSTYSPDSKWDWYQIGGRWSGYFKIKPGHEDEVVVGHPGVFDNSPEAGYCDQGPKRALDIEGMRDDAGGKAAVFYDKYHEAVAGTPEIVPWSVYVAQVKAGDITIEQAREKYHGQPRLQAANEKLKDELGFMFEHDELQVDRRTYIERARAGAVPGYATLYNGKWYAPGEMGWFAASSDDAGTRAGYHEIVNGVIDDQPGDCLFTIVDCHI